MGGGGTSHMKDIRGCAAQIGGFYTHTHTPTHPHTKLRCPFTQVFQLWKPFERGVPFQHLFSFVGCEILITIITIHSINWWNQNYLGAPTTRSEGEEIYIGLCKMGWAAQIGGFYTQKIAGCPFTQVFQLRLPFQKGAPFQHFFS